MTSLISWIFNDQGVEQLLKHNELAGWLTIGTVVYLETAVIFLLFLPVDALIFAAGAFLGTRHASMIEPVLIFSVFALAGDLTAFSLSHSEMGKRVIRGKWISQAKIEQVSDFFKKYGAVAVVACRFIGFARSFSPLAAGLSKIRFLQYLTFDAIGCLAWTATLLTIGYRFGKVSWVQLHLSALMVALVLAALVVFAVQGLRMYISKRN